KMLDCGNPAKMGYVEYRCLHCGQGKHRVAMSCKAPLCLRCAKVHVDTWVSQVSKVLHEGIIYRHIILTVPALFRTTFYQHAAVVLSAFMRCGVQCLDDFYSAVKGKPLTTWKLLRFEVEHVHLLCWHQHVQDVRTRVALGQQLLDEVEETLQRLTRYR